MPKILLVPFFSGHGVLIKLMLMLMLIVIFTVIMWHLRDFAVSGLATWNSLPVELQTSSLCSQTFAKKLKSHLFGC